MVRSRRPRKAALLCGMILLCGAACGQAGTEDSAETTSLETLAPIPTDAVPTPSQQPPPAATSAVTSTQPPATTGAPLAVTAPGTYSDEQFVIKLRFESLVAGISSDQLSGEALKVLNDPDGWSQAGFTFAADDGSELRVVLAEGLAVDELCLPLETYGTVSCQNGPVVALNADRWRAGADDWDSTIADYRRYLVNHEVGHLIGLRHPIERCPSPSRISALMEPQTNNLQGCTGNGIPLPWEIEWASSRPVVVGPAPSWDGPQPTWPPNANP